MPHAVVDRVTLASRIQAALAEVEAVAIVLTTTAHELRRAQTEIANALVDLARIRRELRELDADMTPVRSPSGADVLSARPMVEAFERRKRG